MLKCYIIKLEPDGLSAEQKMTLEQILPKDRYEKMNRLKDERRRRCSLITSAFMQYGISDATGIPIREIQYQYGPAGKPMLAANLLDRIGTIDFNLSHSGEYAVLAVSDKAVGIDIESGTRNWDRVAKSFFCEEEYRDIMDADSEEAGSRRFLEYWTMKEAYVKWDGKGLQIPLSSFRIDRQRSFGLILPEIDHKLLRIMTYRKEKYCIALCSEDVINLQKIKQADDFEKLKTETICRSSQPL